MNEIGLPVIQGNAQSQLYELDRVEIGFWKILLNQGLPAQRKRDADTNTTPRVELELETEVVQSNRRIAANQPHSNYQYFNAWNFKLTATVVTNREQNGDNHGPLLGLVRWNFQMGTIIQTWTPGICATHKIVDMREESCPADVWNDGGCDISAVSFSGMFCIPDPIWP